MCTAGGLLNPPTLIHAIIASPFTQNPPTHQNSPNKQVNHNTFSETQESERNPRVGDKLVSVLPCWHIFERTAEYWMFSKGIHVVYSNVKTFKGDLAKVKI